MEEQSVEQSALEIINKYAQLLRRWAWMLILLVATVSCITYFVARSQAPFYQSSAMVMINVATSSQDPYTSVYLAQTFGESYSEIMTSRTVLDVVAQRLGLKELTAGSVQVKLIPNTQLISIAATDTNPEMAARIANTVIAVFNEQDQSDQSIRYSTAKQNLKTQMDVLDQQIQTTSGGIALLEQEIQRINSSLTNLQTPDNIVRTQAELDQRAAIIKQNQSTLQSKVGEQAQLQIDLQNFQNTRSTLEQSYESIRLAEIQVTSGVILKDPALPPDAPFKPQPLRSALLGGLVTVFLGIAIIYLIDFLDDTFKTPEDISRILDLPVVGMIGEMESLENGPGKVYVGENPRSPIAEAFRVLRTNLEYASVDQPLRTLMVTSVGPEEGKTTTAVNLAVIIAQGGKRVLLLDADLRRPNVHRLLQIQNHTGLSDLFLGSQSDVSKVCTWGETRISVVTSGSIPPNPSEVLGSEKFKQILAKLEDDYGIVLLDSPPSIVSDPVIISSKVDGVLLVIKPGSTKIGAAQVMLEQFQRAGARVVGVVLNPISRKRGNYGGKYQYYSKYYQSSSKSEHYYSNEGDKNRKKKITKETSKDNKGTEDPAQPATITEGK
jgi:succinoglycan biosynthesis transport protein ExoP